MNAGEVTKCDCCLQEKADEIKKYIFRCEPAVKSNAYIKTCQTIKICDDERLFFSYITAKDGMPMTEKEVNERGKGTHYLYACDNCYNNMNDSITFNVAPFVNKKKTQMITKPCVKVTYDIYKQASSMQQANLLLQLYKNMR